jgi:hypothetical protein
MAKAKDAALRARISQRIGELRRAGYSGSKAAELAKRELLTPTPAPGGRATAGGPVQQRPYNKRPGLGARGWHV